MVAAFAYSKGYPEIMDDWLFDKYCLEVDIRKPTSRPDIDKWLEKEFSPSTGSWVLCFPELCGIESYYWKHFHNCNELDGFKKIKKELGVTLEFKKSCCKGKL